MIRSLQGGKKRQQLQPDQRYPDQLRNGDVVKDVRGPLIVYAREPQHDGSVKLWAVNRATREKLVWTVSKRWVFTLDLTLMVRIEDIRENVRVLAETVMNDG